jgi:cytoskeletal protein CcmA (bactofilin family)
MFQKDNMFNRKDDSLRRDGRMPSPLSTPSPVPSSTASPAVHSSARADAQAAASTADEKQGSCLIVGPDIKLKGAEITDCDTLVVEGRVEASMDSRVIQIAEHGAYVGTVGIDVAEIRGRFEGELTARKQLVIHSTGKVSGKVRYGKIVIEAGGEISGDVSSLAPAAQTLRPVTTSKAEPLPDVGAGKTQEDSTTDDSAQKARPSSGKSIGSF